VRFIEKGPEPALLRQWKHPNFGSPQNLRYANMEAPAKEELRECLLREQGFLCAYTTVRIARSESGHIEYLRSQTAYPELDIDYNNMLYCYPGGKDKRCEFGAHKKDDTDLAGAFVSPLEKTCETRLAFDLNGAVKSARPDDYDAKQTIEDLGLNHKELVALRKAAIEKLPFFRKGQKPVSAGKARQLAVAVTHPDESGKIQPFCIAIKQIAERYASQCHARAARIV
jgi:uncharacterized protein (TIGR02646 family)